MRLIDADALNEKLCETTIFIKDGVAFQRMINDAPTIAAVPVVRCKDCIHAQKMNKSWADGRQIVFCWKHGKERFTTRHWYCGARMDKGKQMTREEAIQKRDIIVTQFINELGVTIETNTKPLIHCKDCIHRYATGDVTKYYVCDFMDAQYEDNGYCHHGERNKE